jgi:hypothetical protein
LADWLLNVAFCGRIENTSFTFTQSIGRKTTKLSLCWRMAAYQRGRSRDPLRGRLVLLLQAREWLSEHCSGSACQRPCRQTCTWRHRSLQTCSSQVLMPRLPENSFHKRGHGRRLLGS